jgi:prepilin-type processing-associated H-X9-DG protein/prepilin-type N-terminal cleavage/methylation domain-containing protein
MKLRQSSPVVRDRSPSLAFTLVELLVVVAVIGVLAALIIVALTVAKDKATRARCANNVSQLGLALQEFVTDYQVYPLLVWNKEEGMGTEHFGTCFEALNAEISKHSSKHEDFARGIWRCPSAPRPFDLPDGQVFLSYGYNAYGLGNDKAMLGIGGMTQFHESQAVKESEVASPSDLMAIGDSFTGGNGVIIDGNSLLWRTSGLVDRNGSTQESYKRHSGKANIAFCDGHVALVALDYLFIDLSDASLKCWNRDHESHRDLLLP